MRCLLTCLALLAAPPALADDLPGSSFSFGLWRGGAATDATGAFSHCYATLGFTLGEQLWVNVTKAGMIDVIFSYPGVTFTPGQEIDASLMLESGLPTHGKAVGLDQTHVVFTLKPLNDAHAYLAQGRWLRLMGVGRDEAFDVAGLGGVLGLVRDCAEQHNG